MLWRAILRFSQRFAYVVTFPIAFAIGVIGYKLEGLLTDRDDDKTPWRKSASERREERRMRHPHAEFRVPKSVFENDEKGRKAD